MELIERSGETAEKLSMLISSANRGKEILNICYKIKKGL